MGRWQPAARERLGQAALELYGERGFDDVTVAEIARRAGLTERTFFRHFTDKREVLFAGADQLRDLLVAGVDAAAPNLSPLDTVAAALDGAARMFEERREFAWRRQAVIAANPELQERELIKMASLAASVADALRRRGVAAAEARLAAQTGLAVFGIAFARWVDAAGERMLSDFLAESARDLRRLVVGGRW
jgi:AcrR family transcriptional regulator